MPQIQARDSPLHADLYRLIKVAPAVVPADRIHSHLLGNDIADLLPHPVFSCPVKHTFQRAAEGILVIISAVVPGREAAKSAPPVEVKVFEPSEQQIQEIRKKAYADAKADAEKEAAAAIDAEVEKRCAAFEEQIQRKTLEEDPGNIAVKLILDQIAPLLGLMSSELDRIDDPKITGKALRALESSLVELFGDSWSNRHENQ